MEEQRQHGGREGDNAQRLAVVARGDGGMSRRHLDTASLSPQGLTRAGRPTQQANSTIHSDIPPRRLI